MSLQHYVAIDNARAQLEPLLGPYAAGQLREPELPHAFGILFRQLGTSRLLLEGTAEPFFIGQMQAASCYAFGLASLREEDKATSLAGCWWDAIGGGYWEAARDIARLSRTTHNPTKEHEDDFLYVMFLMTRFCLTPKSAESGVADTSTTGQAAMLQRWEAVLDGAEDPRLDLCRAIDARDASAFQEALVATGEKRAATLDGMAAKGTLNEEQALWVRPVWPEGLGLLRLAEADGLGSDFDCPGVPAVLRVRPPFRYDRNAWRTLDYTPSAR